MLNLAAFCFVIFFSQGFSQEPCSGVFLSVLRTDYHNVGGDLYAEDEYNFCIANFTYDGLGPDAFLYFSYPGYRLQNSGGGVIINITTQTSGRPQFDVNVPRDDVAYRFSLPNKKFRACDFEGFGIWCRYANQLFTNIIWNSTAFSADGTNGTVQCVPSPGRGFVGELSTEAHGVAGDLYVRDRKTFVIRNFRYDGGGPDTFVYWYAPGAEVNPVSGGTIIPLTVSERGPEGEFDSTVYDANYTDDFVITISDDVNIFTCDAGTFTIWCRRAGILFSRVSIDLELFTNNPLEAAYEPNRILCNRPTTQPGVLVGELPDGGNPRAISGTFYVKDQYTFVIQLFSYDSTARQNTVLYYYRLGEDVENTGGGQVIPQSSSMDTFGTEKSDSFYNQDFIVNLRLADIKACQISFFTIYARDDMEHITQIAIPQGIFTADEDEVSNTMILCGAPRLVMTYLVAALFAILAYSLSY